MNNIILSSPADGVAYLLCTWLLRLLCLPLLVFLVMVAVHLAMRVTKLPKPPTMEARP